MTTNTGGPAFSNVISMECVRVEMDGSAEYEPKAQPGNITVRDYFAAKALPSCYDEYLRGVNAGEYAWGDNWQIGVAYDAYKMADAMLKVRDK
jgi:hypothetical protein